MDASNPPTLELGNPPSSRRGKTGAGNAQFRFLAALTLSCALSLTGRSTRAQEHGLWIVITAPEFRLPLEALIEHRRAEGFKVVVAQTTAVLTREQIRINDAWPLEDFIQKTIQTNKGPSSVLLAGAITATEPAVAQRTVVPALTGVTGRMKGLPSDYVMSLRKTNGVPTATIGRFPARTVDELRVMVRKTLDFEQNRRPASWQNSLLLLQGNPGGGPMAELVVEQTTVPRLQQLHPAFRLQAISHCASSRFYLPTAQLHDAAIRYLEAGQLFSFYLGHSDPAGLWSLDAYFMSRDDWVKLKIQQGDGVFFTCGCDSCEWNSPRGEGYGLAAMRNPGGPVAVVGACGESYSALGLLAVDGLLRCLRKAPFPSRLGEYWLVVQEGLAHGEIDEGVFALFDQFDGSGGKVPLSVQRLEHLEMWMLLGDPALHLPIVPVDIALEAGTAATPGKPIKVSGTLPARLLGATVQVTLERPTGSMPADFQKLPIYSLGSYPLLSRYHASLPLGLGRLKGECRP